MTNFLVMPSVALLLHSCYILCSVFKVQLRVYTLKIKQCKLMLAHDLAAACASAKLSLSVCYNFWGFMPRFARHNWAFTRNKKV